MSQKKNEAIVLGADSVIDLEGEIISKPKDRKEALEILKKLNGKKTLPNKLSLYFKKWINDMELY